MNDHDHRDSAGRFTRGNRGGPGNPFARQVAALRRAAVRAVTRQDVDDIVAALKARAKEGDVPAARLLLGYAVGRPGAPADPDTLDAHDLAVRRLNVAGDEDIHALFRAMPAWLLCELAAVTAPIVHARHAGTLGEGLAALDKKTAEGGQPPPKGASRR